MYPAPSATSATPIPMARTGTPPDAVADPDAATLAAFITDAGTESGVLDAAGGSGGGGTAFGVVFGCALALWSAVATGETDGATGADALKLCAGIVASATGAGAGPLACGCTLLVSEPAGRPCAGTGRCVIGAMLCATTTAAGAVDIAARPGLGSMSDGGGGANCGVEIRRTGVGESDADAFETESTRAGSTFAVACPEGIESEEPPTGRGICGPSM
jgi:hypothetical protein